MSRLDEPVDRASLVFSARLTIDAHADGRGCQCCTPDGCRQLAWAKGVDPEYTARLRQTTPASRPAA